MVDPHKARERVEKRVNDPKNHLGPYEDRHDRVTVRVDDLRYLLNVEAKARIAVAGECCTCPSASRMCLMKDLDATLNGSG